MTDHVKPSVAKKPDPLAPLRAKVQTLRRLVPSLNDDDTWRAFLANHAQGETSTRAMRLGQLEAVVNALHAAGAPKRPAKTAGKRRLADTAQMDMIRALWLQLHARGAVDNATEAAIGAFVKRMTRQDIGVLSPKDANTVIEALKDWRTRTEADPVLVVKRAALAAHGRPLDPARFIDALWAGLIRAGAFPQAGLHASLGDWLVRQGWAVAAPQFLTAEQQEAATRTLSAWLRRMAQPKAPA